VSRKLGHASVKTTLDVYAHLFDGVQQGQRTRAALESAFGKIVESSSGNQRENARGSPRTEPVDSSQAETTGKQRGFSRPL
jgi:hypothetical protein